jgi:predicted dehydrogenase
VTLRVATLGAGYFSRFHHRAWKRMADVELVAIADHERHKAEAFAVEFSIPAVFTDVETMLAEMRPDVIDIVAPPQAHLPAIRAAARHGIHAICQKAFCQSLDEAREAVAIAGRAGITLAVHENFRFQPWHQKVRQFIAAGALGDIYQLTFRLRPGDGQGPDAYLDRQPYFRSMERLLVHETAIHHIDLFRYLLGEPDSIYADLRRMNPVIAGEDAGLIVMTMPSGARAIFDGNRCSDHVATNRRLTMGEMLIEGSAGVLRLDGEGRLFRRDHGQNDERQHSFSWSDIDFGGDCVYRTQRAFIDALKAGTEPANRADRYLANIMIEEAVYRSDAEGRRITL